MFNNTKKSIKSVTQVTFDIQQLLESQFAYVWVKGEISNFKHHTSGHMYFSLKDSRAQISAVMFHGSNSKLVFKPSDGQEVVVLAKVTVYAPRGNYQLVVNEMTPAGLGDLHQAFELLKQKLLSEGLFDAKHKKQIPAYPRAVGVVTSKTGAAIRDIINVAKRRHPGIPLTVYNARVQGIGAAEEIIRGIDIFEKMRQVDVIIIGRGGGSLEDMWPFNNEELARTIYNAGIPIVSAVGHEVDYSISDWVADLRAPTPSAAAEIVFPEKSKMAEHLTQKSIEIVRLLQSTINIRRKHLMALSSSYGINSLPNRIRYSRQTLDSQSDKISNLFNALMLSRQNQLRSIEKNLLHLNPDSVVKRGYAIVRNETGKIIQNKRDAKELELLNIQLAKGSINARVEK